MDDAHVAASLRTLAGNLRWVWDRPTQEVFAEVDPARWESRRDPVELVRELSPERLARLAAEPGFRERLDRAATGLAEYMAGQAAEPLVAYFCMEHGVAPHLPSYAGGLGMLAGDIEKTASDLALPVVAVGLMYHLRLRQRLSYGWQNDGWERFDPAGAGLEPCPGGTVTVDLAGEPVAVRTWRAQVGRVALYLLDTDIPENPPRLRSITDRLYGGDREHRLRQEIVLGIGGVRVLAAMGVHPEVVHTNEGHAGFVCLERLLRLVRDGHGLDRAVAAVRQTTIFTTHTAVPAGFDLFDRWLIEKYFAGWAADCEVSLDWLMDLGHFPGQGAEEPFNMAVLCARLSENINAVSRLHREVTERRVLGRLWSGRAAPVVAVTNGVHPATWTPPAMADLLDAYVGPGWEYAGPDRWEAVWDIPDEELWRVRQDLRAGLVDFVRDYLPAALRAQGWGEDLDWARRVLDPEALLVVVARRAAEYKETDLLVSSPERLRALAFGAGRPVCVVYSGLAHPQDQGAKERIRRIVQFSLGREVRARVVFLPGYDMLLASRLLAGADVWLNHPRRGEEACGTSFMKSVYGGGRIMTTADGGADELVIHGRNGWIIGDRVDGASREAMAGSAFELLEREVVPEFYDRDPGGVPRRWVDGVKRSLASLGWQVSSVVMTRAYERMYRDAARAVQASATAGPVPGGAGITARTAGGSAG
ncbi:MAG TPA: alpha-glucan family phosphorylase [Pilimelia sp.]|nr:alpha-glucan family phosphorylase [Pilimelia sp.]